MGRDSIAFATGAAVAPTLRRSGFVCRPTAAQFKFTTAPTRRVVCQMTLGEEVEDNVATEDTKLFVGNLSWDTSDQSLGDAFSRYGTVIDARVITDRFTGKSRGFGFIEYESAACADDALEGMNGSEVDGRRIRVDRANKRQPPRPRPEY